MFQAAPNAANVGVTLSINMPGSDQITKNTSPKVNGHSNSDITLHAKTDSSQLKRIDPETLEPQGIARQVQLHPDLKGPFSAAHAKSDPITGDIFNFNLEIGYNSTYRLFRTSASTGATDVLATFNGLPAYIHSIFLTENYVVLCVWNSYITWSGLSLLYERNVLDAIAPFDPNSKAKWYVVDRKSDRGLVATYESDPFYCFHSVNAWEEPSPSDPSKTDIITELSLYENTDVVHRFFYDNLISSINTPEYDGKKRMSCLPMQAQYRLPAVGARVTAAEPLPAGKFLLADKIF